MPEQDDNIFHVLAEGMDERDLFILEHRILGSMRLEEIGERYGISGERVRQLEKKLKNRLRTRLIRSRNAATSCHECCVCDQHHASNSGTIDHDGIMRAKDSDAALIDDTLQALIGKRIVLELESGEQAEGVMTKVRTRQVHLSSPAAYGMNESVVDVDEIVSFRRIDRFEASETL